MPAQLFADPSVWKLSTIALCQYLETSLDGISDVQAAKRLAHFGPNDIEQKNHPIIVLFLRQITTNPLILILLIATAIAWFLGERISTLYIVGMILLSSGLGFWNEYQAEKIVNALLGAIAPLVTVVRNGEKKVIPKKELTIGDVVLVSQGTIIPADLRLVVANRLEVNESMLTGESQAVNKHDQTLPSEPKTIGDCYSIAFMGTIVESGWGKGVVIGVGKHTQFGAIAQTASFVKPTTEFQKGLSQFGMLLVRVISILTMVMFGLNTLLGRPVLESLLFALAIAVGLTPELLPIIVTISLSHGAGKLAKRHVIAKQLISIENLGNMDILCTDKTGTLTEGSVQLLRYLDSAHRQNRELLQKALICNSAALHHKAIGNSIDTALWNYAQKHTITIPRSWKKLEEEPLDFDKRYMFTVISKPNGIELITKGAPEAILPLCTTVHRKQAEKEYQDYIAQGYRVLAVATKSIARKTTYSWLDTSHMNFCGFLLFADIPKPRAADAIARLTRLNVQTKVITGDNEVIAQRVCFAVGINGKKVLTGSQIDALSDTQMKQAVEDHTIFARVNPHQKLRIIQMLRANGHTVGYLGDGINDIPALKGADVGISVNTASDVSKQAASIVLLRKSLDVIADGIIEGRKTFQNTMKYILMGTSSNFGNMFSAAGASLFLPFLPMTPPQILLNNGLYDLSQTSIPTDSVDPEALVKPKKWDMTIIKKYMLVFGPASSLFDFLTFFLLLRLFNSNQSLFQTGWFLESIATQVLVVFVIRTNRTPFFASIPGKWLVATCFAIVGLAYLLPFSPLATSLGFTAPTVSIVGFLLGLTVIYLMLVEFLKAKLLSPPKN